MAQNLSLWQRITSDTPPLFKGIQAALVILFAVGGYHFSFVPAPIEAAISSWTMLLAAGICQLVVKDVGQLAASTNPLGDALEMLKNLPGQIENLLTLVKNAPVATVDSQGLISSITDAVSGKVDEAVSTLSGAIQQIPAPATAVVVNAPAPAAEPTAAQTADPEVKSPDAVVVPIPGS